MKIIMTNFIITLRYEVFMNKMFKLMTTLLILGLTIPSVQAENRIVSTVKNIPVNTYGNTYNNGNVYSNDLSIVEDYLFGRIYRNESTGSRLNRIERRLYRRNYASANTAQRMNNILSNYRDDYNNRNYLADYYSNRTPAQRIYNRFIGQPTGFTPSIINSPFGSNFFNPGFSSSYTGNRGYGYNNSIPAVTGAGIRILD